jgi:hypothetical protein
MNKVTLVDLDDCADMIDLNGVRVAFDMGLIACWIVGQGGSRFKFWILPKTSKQEECYGTAKIDEPLPRGALHIANLTNVNDDVAVEMKSEAFTVDAEDIAQMFKLNEKLLEQMLLEHQQDGPHTLH